MNKEAYLYVLEVLNDMHRHIVKERNEHIIETNARGCLPNEKTMLDFDERLEKCITAMAKIKGDYEVKYAFKISPEFHAEPIVSPYDFGFADKSSALKTIKHDIAKLYPFVMCYACKDEMLTFFATLLMNYSNHDKRDVEITLKEIEHGRIHWQLTSDHEILDCGDYIIDKDVPF